MTLLRLTHNRAINLDDIRYFDRSGGVLSVVFTDGTLREFKFELHPSDLDLAWDSLLAATETLGLYKPEGSTKSIIVNLDKVSYVESSDEIGYDGLKFYFPGPADSATSVLFVPYDETDDANGWENAEAAFNALMDHLHPKHKSLGFIHPVKTTDTLPG